MKMEVTDGLQLEHKSGQGVAEIPILVAARRLVTCHNLTPTHRPSAQWPDNAS